MRSRGNTPAFASLPWKMLMWHLNLPWKMGQVQIAGGWSHSLKVTNFLGLLGPFYWEFWGFLGEGSGWVLGVFSGDFRSLWSFKV